MYAASTGLLIGSRSGKSAQNGYVAHLGILGRESYTFDAADPRFVTEMLASPSLDPGSPAFGGNLWTQPYANIGNANTVLVALDKVSGVSDQDKEAIRGFAKTMQALDFLMVAVTRDTNGGPIDVGDGISRLGAIESKDALLEHVSTLLDEAKAHLEAAGDDVPVPAQQRLHGLRHAGHLREVQPRGEGSHGGVPAELRRPALQALSESFVDTTKPLTEGVYYAYGTGSGDATNGLTSPNIFAHPSIVTDTIADPGSPRRMRLHGRTPRCPSSAWMTRIGRKLKEVDPRTYQQPHLQVHVPHVREQLGAGAHHPQRGAASSCGPRPTSSWATSPPPRRTSTSSAQVSGGLPPVDLTGENAVDILLNRAPLLAAVRGRAPVDRHAPLQQAAARCPRTSRSTSSTSASPSPWRRRTRASSPTPVCSRDPRRAAPCGPVWGPFLFGLHLGANRLLRGLECRRPLGSRRNRGLPLLGGASWE